MNSLKVGRFIEMLPDGARVTSSALGPSKYILLRTKVPMYRWKPLLAFVSHKSTVGRQWRSELTSQQSKYLQKAQNHQTLYPWGFPWFFSPPPRFLSILLSLLLPFRQGFTHFCPFHSEAKIQMRNPSLNPCWVVSQSSALLLPAMLSIKWGREKHTGTTFSWTETALALREILVPDVKILIKKSTSLYTQ